MRGSSGDLSLARSHRCAAHSPFARDTASSRSSTGLPPVRVPRWTAPAPAFHTPWSPASSSRRISQPSFLLPSRFPSTRHRRISRNFLREMTPVNPSNTRPTPPSSTPSSQAPSSYASPMQDSCLSLSPCRLTSRLCALTFPQRFCPPPQSCCGSLRNFTFSWPQPLVHCGGS